MADLYLPGDLPGLLDDWCGPIEVLCEGKWWKTALIAFYDGEMGIAGEDGVEPLSDPSTVRLPLSRPEVRHHVALTWGPLVDATCHPMTGSWAVRHWMGVMVDPAALQREVARLVVSRTEPNWTPHHGWARGVLEEG